MCPSWKSFNLPFLENDNIYVFIAQYNNNITTILEKEYFDYLSAEEQLKYHRFYFDKDKKLYLLSRAVFKSCLSHYANCHRDQLLFDYGSYGKPELKNDKRITFNLSHSNDVVVFIISKSRKLSLGVDVQYCKNQNDLLNLAAHYFSEIEYQAIINAPEDMRNNIFFKLWTLKEAYIKAIGKGLSIPLKDFTFTYYDSEINIKHFSNHEDQYGWSFFLSHIYENHALSLAIRNSQKKLYETQQIQTYEYYPFNYCINKNVDYTKQLF